MKNKVKGTNKNKTASPISLIILSFLILVIAIYHAKKTAKKNINKLEQKKKIDNIKKNPDLGKDINSTIKGVNKELKKGFNKIGKTIDTKIENKQNDIKKNVAIKKRKKKENFKRKKKRKRKAC